MKIETQYVHARLTVTEGAQIIAWGTSVQHPENSITASGVPEQD